MESQPSLQELMKTLAKLSDKRDQIAYQSLIRKWYININFILLSLTDFWKEGSRFRGVALTIFLWVEKSLKEVISAFLIIIPGHLKKKKHLTFTLIFIYFLAPWWFFLCWQKQISGLLKRPHTHRVSLLLALSQYNIIFKSFFLFVWGTHMLEWRL